MCVELLFNLFKKHDWLEFNLVEPSLFQRDIFQSTNVQAFIYVTAQFLIWPTI